MGNRSKTCKIGCVCWCWWRQVGTMTTKWMNLYTNELGTIPWGIVSGQMGTFKFWISSYGKKTKYRVEVLQLEKVTQFFDCKRVIELVFYWYNRMGNDVPFIVARPMVYNMYNSMNAFMTGSCVTGHLACKCWIAQRRRPAIALATLWWI